MKNNYSSASCSSVQTMAVCLLLLSVSPGCTAPLAREMEQELHHPRLTMAGWDPGYRRAVDGPDDNYVSDINSSLLARLSVPPYIQLNWLVTTLAPKADWLVLAEANPERGYWYALVALEGDQEYLFTSGSPTKEQLNGREAGLWRVRSMSTDAREFIRRLSENNVFASKEWSFASSKIHPSPYFIHIYQRGSGSISFMPVFDRTFP